MPTLRRGRVELDVLLVFEAVRAALELLYKSLSFFNGQGTHSMVTDRSSQLLWRIGTDCQPALLWHPSPSKWNNLEQWDLNASERELCYFEP